VWHADILPSGSDSSEPYSANFDIEKLPKLFRQPLWVLPEWLQPWWVSPEWSSTDVALRKLRQMMTDPDCIFCSIVAGKIPADILARTDRVIAFRDLNPQASTHVLVVTADHYPNVVELAAADPRLLAELVAVGAEIAQKHEGGSFRLIFNVGAQAGQSVFHVHGHVLAGELFGGPLA
jgi:histidine triad (HIT) family protein